jgi:hypothetical protein
VDYLKITQTVIIFVVCNILIWYQLNSQLVWDWAKSNKAVLVSCLLGIPISYMFWYCTKIGYEGFGALWPVRFMGFATSMLTFPIMTYYYLGEPLTMKTIVTLILSICIMIIQIL